MNVSIDREILVPRDTSGLRPPSYNGATNADRREPQEVGFSYNMISNLFGTMIPCDEAVSLMRNKYEKWLVAVLIRRCPTTCITRCHTRQPSTALNRPGLTLIIHDCSTVAFQASSQPKIHLTSECKANPARHRNWAQLPTTVCRAQRTHLTSSSRHSRVRRFRLSVVFCDPERTNETMC